MNTIQATKEKEVKKEKKFKIITILLLIFFVILLLLSGYTFAKSIEGTIINSNALLAEPILVVENNPSVDITATKNTGTYIFKVKTYKEQKKSDVDLKFFIQVISDVDKSIELKLYENGKQIDFNNNKTNYIKISKDNKKENEYRLEITYNKDKLVSVSDIIQQIQIKIHTEQEKA